jgi:hypothetical protein
MNTLSSKIPIQGGLMQQHSIDIKTFSYAERAAVLPQLTTSFADCGGWVLDRKTLSPTTVQFRIEIQLRSVLDLYTAILSVGIELTRAAHLSFQDLCTCRQHLQSSVELGQVLTLRIEISFLDDVTLHSLLSTIAPPA